MGKAAIAAIIVIVIIAIVIGLFYYSYSQIQVSLNDVKFHSIEWTTFSWSTLVSLGLNALTGNWLGAAFDLIDGVNLNLIFGLSNHGLFPVYIPNLSYDLYVNGAYVGTGYSDRANTIYPGQTDEFPILQNFKKSSLNPAISSIISNGGVMEIKVKGTAYFQILGFSIPVPFESSKQISIYDEIRSRLNDEIQKQQEIERQAAAARAAAAVKAAADVAAKFEESLKYSAQALLEQLFGSPKDLDLKLPGKTIIDDTYQVYPGGYSSHWIDITCHFNLKGGFIASAALGNDIKVYILSEDNFKSFEKGQNVPTYYNSDKVESGIFDVTLTAGKYYIVMDNRYSIFSSKNVQLQAAWTCV